MTTHNEGNARFHALDLGKAIAQGDITPGAAIETLQLGYDTVNWRRHVEAANNGTDYDEYTGHRNRLDYLLELRDMLQQSIEQEAQTLVGTYGADPELYEACKNPWSQWSKLQDML